MIIILFITIFLILLGWWEYRVHGRALAAIPTRIHVNGSRGKSSVTRLIAAGLRAGGIRTIAKTTGTLPRIIDEHGLEIPIHRLRSPSIGEQIRALRFAARRHPQALVVECMAVKPQFQWISEQRMIRSTLGAFTNVRPDHLDEMGPTLTDVALSLCNTLPQGRKAFTTERVWFPLMEKTARRMKTDLKAVKEDSVSPEEIARFRYPEHQDNVALALAICQACGVERQTALGGMVKAYPDPGALQIFHILEDNRDLYFVNALAANDPDSTWVVWGKARDLLSPIENLIVILNSRSDRFGRSLQLLSLVWERIRPDWLVLTGERTRAIWRRALRQGFSPDRMVNLGGALAGEVYRKVKALSGPKVVVLAIGNMGAGGRQLAACFKEHGGQQA